MNGEGWTNACSGRRHPFTGELVDADNASEDGENAAHEPPADGVIKEVNLLFHLRLGPEAYSSQEKQPLNRLACIWVAAGQSIVVEEHGPG